MTKPRAFTIIELLVVMAIASILLVISVPAVKSIAKDNDRVQSINLIKAAISEARSLALSGHRQAGVVFFQESPTHAFPYHGSLTTMQLFVEDYNQVTTPAKNPKNTLFIQSSPARTYLPAGMTVASLNDMLSKGVVNVESSGARDLAILFDANGQMTARHGVARRDFVAAAAPGSYPYAIADWNFATQGTTTSDNSGNGISSPGIFLYDRNEYAAQNIPAGTPGDAQRNVWVKHHATVLSINANTGRIQE